MIKTKQEIINLIEALDCLTKEEFGQLLYCLNKAQCEKINVIYQIVENGDLIDCGKKFKDYGINCSIIHKVLFTNIIDIKNDDGNYFNYENMFIACKPYIVSLVEVVNDINHEKEKVLGYKLNIIKTKYNKNINSFRNLILTNKSKIKKYIEQNTKILFDNDDPVYHSNYLAKNMFWIQQAFWHFRQYTTEINFSYYCGEKSSMRNIEAYALDFYGLDMYMDLIGYYDPYIMEQEIFIPVPILAKILEIKEIELYSLFSIHKDRDI